jgi:apolipoprotein N-acyltransferase
LPGRWWLLPGFTGFLLFASFPKLDQHYLAWIAFIPLLFYLSRESRLVASMFAGLVAGTLQWLGLLIWIPPVLTDHGGMASPLALLLYVLLALMLSLFPAFTCLVTRLLMNRLGEVYVLTFPVTWVGVEFFRNYIPFGGFPWLLIGYSQTEVLWLVQIADIAGVHGVSLLILMVNTAIFWLALKGIDARSGRRMAALTAALFAATGIYGYCHLEYGRLPEPGRSAVLLQGNLSMDDPHTVLAQKLRHGYGRLAAEVDSADLVVLPEAPAALDYRTDPEYGLAIRRLSALSSLGLILNDIRYGDSDGSRRVFNSALFLDPEGRQLARYDKIQLVPFGEYVPMRSLFFFAESITKDVSDFQPGSEYTLFQLGDHRANAVICFEAIFSGLCREFVRAGSQLIVNLTNDRWYGDSAAPHQHLAMARWRSIENRRYLLRATNSGISAIIDPYGRAHHRTALLQEDLVRGNFEFLDTLTLYTRSGDVLPILCAIIMCLLLIRSYRLKRVS